MEKIGKGGIYIHVPFCNNKCLYCDFYSGGSRIADWDKYVLALQNELNSREKELVFDPLTLYIGGGTPSLMPIHHLRMLIHYIKKKVSKTDWDEFTLEVNPEDVTKNNCEEWKSLGVNRVSLGLQTLNTDLLKKIGRRHDDKTGLKALELLLNTFNNVSVDLMFGLPEQSLSNHEKTIDIIINLRPHHISSYSLMLEPGTPMTLLENQGKIILPPEEDWIRMFQMTVDKLKSSGYIHYEISNYSLPGYQSVHNTSYWQGAPYLGLGPSAHSYDGVNIRRANPKDIKGYLKNFLNPVSSIKKIYSEEYLSYEERREEMVMTRLRTSQGLNLKEFLLKFGKENKKKLQQKSREYIFQGLMKESMGYLSFTEKGILVSDTILSHLI